MRRIFRWPTRRRAQVETDVDAELQFHVAERTDDLRAGGLPTGEARRRAHDEFGDVDRARADLRRDGLRHARRLRVGGALEELRQDVRHAARTLRRAPGFTAVVVLTLALGIGATTTMFALVDGVLLRPLPYAEPERLVAVWPERTMSTAELARVERGVRSLAAVGAYEGGVGMSLGGETPLRVEGAVATDGLFALLGARAALGRTLAAGDERPGAAPVVVLSDALWRTRFGGEPDVVGRIARVDGVDRTIVGVMPPDFRYPAASTRLWTPLVVDPADVGTDWGQVRYRVVGRLAATATPAAARAEVLGVARRTRVENPLWTPDEAGYLSAADVVPLHAQVTGGVRRMLLVLLGAVGLVLLVACVNVANLLLARGVARGREIAVRSALGAGRGRLVRQLLTESLLLGALGAGLGAGLAVASVRLLARVLPSDTPRLAEVAVDGRALAFAAVVTLLTTLVVGLLPALRASRPAAPALATRGGAPPSRRRLSAALVVAETACAVVLVTGAGLLVRSFWMLQQEDPGLRVERVVTARVSPPEREYADAARRLALHAEVLERVAALPGVRTAAVTSQLPFDGGAVGHATAVEGVAEDMSALPTFDFRQVTPDYFATLGVPLRRGRGFTPADGPGAPLVAIVDEAAVAAFWPGQDPIGRRVYWPWMDEYRMIVGVVGTTRNELGASPRPGLYVPFAQRPTAAAVLAVRTDAAPSAVAARLRSLVAAIDPDVPVSDVRAMDELLASSVARPRLTMLLLAGFAGTALLLGAIGLYGVIAYEVGGRTREIGVRMALGAHAGDVLRSVLARGVGLVLVGTVVGLAGALALGGVLESLLYGVSATDPWTFGAVPLALVLVAVAATLVPARRAARVDPAIALRAE